MKKLVVFVAAAVSLIASQPALAFGANSDQNLKLEVAQQVMVDTHREVGPEQITLHDVHRGAFHVTWKATAPNGEYACRADDMLKNVSCTHLEKS